jgi:uncharacterized damage-inducible protein DinB
MPADDLRFPIGRWSAPDADPALLSGLVDDIAAAPAAMRAAVAGLSAAQLDTPYREGGWTVRQVVHHLADSHMNAYVRVKKALTEPGTPITAYEESRWAELPDSQLEPEVSLRLVESLHERWVVVWRSLAPADFERTYLHPEMGPVTLRTALGIYAWHGQHHTAHVTRLRERMGW